jgi:hypothetical protein
MPAGLEGTMDEDEPKAENETWSLEWRIRKWPGAQVPYMIAPNHFSKLTAIHRLLFGFVKLLFTFRYFFRHKQFIKRIT